MKYAFLCSFHFISPTGGVQYQAQMWKDGLERLGHQVDLIDNWSGVYLENYDVVLVFGIDPGIRTYWKNIYKANAKLVVAPIIDPKFPDFLIKFFVKYWGSQKYLGLSSRYHDMWLARKYPQLWLVRSEEERHFVNYCIEIPQERIVKVPLHFRIPEIDSFPEKEDFCLHVSRLDSPNKNVPRIIAAAKKYGFKLKLAGYIKSENMEWLKSLIGDADNIEYLGRLSEEDLLKAYKRAKVFALPTVKEEGVGMVALEAAAYGSEIVLTNYGAPKEYYDGRAILVNSKSVDEIGKGIMKALNEGYSQPELKSFIEQHYSEEACMRLLHESICKALNLPESKD